MKISSFMKRGLMLLPGLIIAQYGMAQQVDNSQSPTAIELIKARMQWFHSGNSAGMIFDNLANFGSLRAAYNPTSGDFKRPQQGKRENSFKVATEGGQSIREGYGWGNFEYGNVTSRDSRFNTAMLDPFRGMPYYPVDPNISDWKKQNYLLQMKISAPVSERYALGIEADYTTQTGAKQVDPRSEQYLYSLSVRPGIAAAFGEHRFGLNLEYLNRIQETRRHTNSNSQVNQDVFVLRGLGNHHTAVIGGLQSLGSFLYNANAIGGGIQYGYTLGKTNLLLAAKYVAEAEDAIQDVSKPKKVGSLRKDLIQAGITAVRDGSNLSRFELSYEQSRTKGIEFVQVLDNSFDVQQWVDLYSSVRSTFSYDGIHAAYSFYKRDGADYKWRAGAFANYTLHDDVYLVPASNLSVENVLFGVDGTLNLGNGSNRKFSLGAEAAYHNNISGAYNYGGAEPTSVVITELMSPDFLYLTQSFYKLGGSISYNFGVNSQRSSNGLFLKISTNYIKPVEGAATRLQSSFGLGLIF